MSAGFAVNQPAVATPFDNETNGFSAMDVQTAIEELNVNGALYNFSWRIILAGKTVIVPYEQQMVLYQTLEIQDTGILDIQGEVAILL